VERWRLTQGEVERTMVELSITSTSEVQRFDRLKV